MTKMSKLFGFVGGAVCALGLVAGTGYVFADTQAVSETVQTAQVILEDSGAAQFRSQVAQFAQDNGLDQFVQGENNFGRGGRHGANPLADYISREDMNLAVADALGISVDELAEARDAGTRLPDLAEELGVDMADVEAAVQVVFNEAIEQALADGAITEEQAEMLRNRAALDMGRDGRHGRHGANPLADYISRDDVNLAVADALGISVDELAEARDAGTRLPDLAEELGVDMVTVEEAVQAVHNEAIDQALADGVITEEQADMLRNRETLDMGRGGRRGGNPLADYVSRDDVNLAVADALGISVDELAEARDAGTRLPDLAAELGVDMADVEAAVKDVVNDAVAVALEDGAITEEQADRILNSDALPLGGGHGRHGGHHGGNGEFVPPPAVDVETNA